MIKSFCYICTDIKQRRHLLKTLEQSCLLLVFWFFCPPPHSWRIRILNFDAFPFDSLKRNERVQMNSFKSIRFYSYIYFWFTCNFYLLNTDLIYFIRLKYSSDWKHFLAGELKPSVFFCFFFFGVLTENTVTSIWLRSKFWKVVTIPNHWSWCCLVIQKAFKKKQGRSCDWKKCRWGGSGDKERGQGNEQRECSVERKSVRKESEGNEV